MYHHDTAAEWTYDLTRGTGDESPALTNMHLAGHQLAMVVRTADPAEQLRQLVTVEQRAADARRELVAELRNARGYSWTQVAEVLGITKQGAAKVYGEFAEVRFRMAMKADRAADRAAVLGTSSATETTQVAPVEQLATTAHWADGTGRTTHPGEYAACPMCHPAPSAPVAAPAVDVPLELEQAELPAAAHVYEPETLAVAKQLARELADADPVIELPREGWAAAECPECGVEPGEPCRVRPSYAYTRGLRPHGRRVRAAAKAEEAEAEAEHAAELAMEGQPKRRRR